MMAPSSAGMLDLVVGGIEGYLFHYKCLSTEPSLRFANPVRLRVGDEEIRRFGKPNPSAGHWWGGSQGPLDGFMGGASTACTVAQLEAQGPPFPSLNLKV